MTKTTDDGLRVIQIGASTSDLPATVRLFAEAFGFENAGANMLWGRTIGIQGLPPDSRALVWWMIGAQDFFQLEFFQYTRPLQRLKRRDWRSSDLGWSRFGIAVSEFDDCMRSLASNNMQTITRPITVDGLRRVAFVEPYLMTVIEVLEKQRAGEHAADGPEVVYITSSVSNLAAARAFYAEVLNFPISQTHSLHTEEHEALWGLKGAKRSAFTAGESGDILLEVVEYENPIGRPRADDYRVSDQGIINICAGSRAEAPVLNALDRAIASGLIPPRIEKGAGTVCGYLLDREREVELSAIPREADAVAGFTRSFPFLT